MPIQENNPILLFDGICNFCNSWVNFLILHDTRKKFRFASLQSDAGKRILSQYAISSKEESVIVISGDKVYIKSSAVLQVLYQLGGLYSLGSIFVIIPKYIRDFCYDLIARNRYKWRGKRNECMLPTEEIKNRFIV